MSHVAITPAVVSRLGIPDSLATALTSRVGQTRMDINVLIQQLGMMTAGVDPQLISGHALAARQVMPAPAQILAENGCVERGMNAWGGTERVAPFGKGKLGRSIEKAMRKDPALKSRLEKMLGGIIIPDGKKDGVLTVYKPGSPLVAQQLRNAIKSGEIANTGCCAALARTPVRRSVGGGVVGGCMQRMAANVTSLAQNVREQGGLPQGMGNMSFEDMVTFLLMKYAEKKEKEILNKVQQLDKGGAAPGATGSKGGAWASMGGTMQQQLGVGAAGGTQDFGGVKGDPSKMSDTMKQQLLQKLMSDLQKMYEMLSNMMKSMDAMEQTPIRALKG
ncbi:MAG: hypothetical protein AB2A00_28030 [Myxococcota bacterium]